MGPNINEGGHGNLSKRVTSECRNREPAMGISRLREEGEICSWKGEEQGREWEKMTESRQKPETEDRQRG